MIFYSQAGATRRECEKTKKAGHQGHRIEISYDSDVRPFGDSLGLVQATDPLLGTSAICALFQKLLASLSLSDGLVLETRYDKSI